MRVTSEDSTPTSNDCPLTAVVVIAEEVDIRGLGDLRRIALVDTVVLRERAIHHQGPRRERLDVLSNLDGPFGWRWVVACTVRQTLSSELSCDGLQQAGEALLTHLGSCAASRFRSPMLRLWDRRHISSR